MKICGIICEYNPMHIGHIKQIQTLKNEYNFDYIIAIMSGNFTERGDIAILDKYTRAKIAVENGIDMVVQIPTPRVTSCANIFAKTGCEIAKEMGLDALSFGVETTNFDALKVVAKIIRDEPKEYINSYKKYRASGLNHPKATMNAVIDYNKTHRILKSSEINDILTRPNNILGIEYLNAIYGTDIEPIILTRDSDYNDTNLEKNVSSSAIRKYLYENGDVEKIKDKIPDSLREILQNNYPLPNIEHFDTTRIDVLKCKTKEELIEFNDIDIDLANRIIKQNFTENDTKNTILKICRKCDTNAKINRILTNILLNITKNDSLLSKTCNIEYIKVLAMRNDKKLLSRLSRCQKLVYRKSDAERFYSVSPRASDIEDIANLIYSRMQNRPTPVTHTKDIFVPCLIIKE